MNDIEPIHFGLYSNKALKLIRKFASDSVYFYRASFKRANDNEIVFSNYETQMLYTSKQIRDIVISRLIKNLEYAEEIADLVKLINILRNSENLTEDEKKLIGKPLNPFVSEAIDTIEAKKYELKTKFKLAMQRLKLQLKNKLEKLDKQIEELRK